MKFYDKILLILILSTTNFLISQAPSQFTYQSVVRTNSGSLVSNQQVGFRFTVLKGSELGSIVFEEEHTVTTNINGLATMIIGKGSGTDNLSEIDWGIDSYFLKVEVDPEGGFNYVAEDTTQLLSVPFALYSNSSGSNLTITGQDFLTISNNEITVSKVDLAVDVEGILPVQNGGTGSSTAPMVGVITALDAASARNVLGLSTVASSGSYNDLTDKLTAGTNIDITDGVISSTDTNTTYTAGTGISIDGNNSISSTITQYTDADAQAAFTAGTNIDITDGVISSTDTNTTYTASTGIAIDGNNAISTTVTDTDTVRSVTAGGNTLADSEILAITAGTNVTITENAGAVTISSTDTNTTYTASTGIAIDGNNAISTTVTDTNTTYSISPEIPSTGSGVIFRLSDNNSGTDDIKFQPSGSTSITRYDTNTIEISSINYGAGTGLSLSSNNFNLNHLGLQDLSDPNSDRFIFWDDSESKINWLSASSLFDIIDLSPNDDNFIVGNGTNFITESGATARSSLGLGTMSTQDNNSVNIDGGNIDGSTISTSDITVGSGKTIDVSEGTLTLENDQISGDKVEGGTIASTTITSLTTNSITNSGKRIDDSGGSSGVTTINATVGRVKINSGQSSINILNSYVDANSIIICTVAQNSDSTRYITQVVAGTETFTIDLNGGAPGSGILINFLIIN
ncbi:MAG: beta strand repeat-containing protein [Flavobacteriaceae bacterium]